MTFLEYHRGKKMGCGVCPPTQGLGIKIHEWGGVSAWSCRQSGIYQYIYSPIITSRLQVGTSKIHNTVGCGRGVKMEGVWAILVRI